MRKFIFLLVITGLLVSCKGDNNPNNCNNLLNVNVFAEINLNLPQYNALLFPNNPIYEPNLGNGGVIINNIGNGYVAFDAADPNHPINTCSVLTIQGIEGVCGCDDNNTYSLVTGQALGEQNLPCGLKIYIVQQNGNSLIISN